MYIYIIVIICVMTNKVQVFIRHVTLYHIHTHILKLKLRLNK